MSSSTWQSYHSNSKLFPPPLKINNNSTFNKNSNDLIQVEDLPSPNKKRRVLNNNNNNNSG